MKYLIGFCFTSLCAFSIVQAQVITQWTPFSDCSATCNVGNQVRTRTRICTPASSNVCQGVSLIETTPCNTEYACPDYRLGDWGSWSACSESCRATQSFPTRVRTRTYCLSNSTSTYQCTSDFMVSYEPCNIVACSIVKSCNNLNFTYVFLLDVSSSIDPDQWISEKDFVKGFINNSSFEVNKNVDVAVVTFSNDAVIQLPCGKFTTKKDFTAFMDSLVLPGGATGINRGLNKAREAYQSCSKNNQIPVVILLTDGAENVDNNNSSRFLTEAQIKREALLVAGGVAKIDKVEIDRITSYTINGQSVSYAFYADTFTNLLTSFGNQLYPFVLEKSQCESQGAWTSWTSWGGCSQLCGATGFMQRFRTCLNPFTNKVQEDCENVGNIANIDFMTCFEPCASLSAWSSWGACSATCRLESGPPVTTRSRTCSGIGSCIGSLSETQECNTNTPCPGIISSWGVWGQCSASCQLTSVLPTQQRSRTCVGATLGGNCDGQTFTDFQSCNGGVFCPGTISEWSSWGACSDVCNNLVTPPSQSRSRSCIGFSTFDPNYSGCPSNSRSEQQGCNLLVGCSGTYTAWGAWGGCSETCQSNANLSPFQTQSRQCVGITLGGSCSGPSSQTQACNIGVVCSGVLGTWTAYGECSASCQLNFIVPTQTRTRTCTGASLGGNCNAAVLSQSQNCNAEVICPGTLSDWSVWGACSATCNTQVNGPFQLRNRQCVGASTWNPTFIGCNNAVVQEQQLCNQLVPCPGVYGAWTAWEVCSETCQSNTNTPPFQRQTRPCIGATLNGGCPGAASQTQVCNVGVSCPGVLGTWTAYGECSASCQLNFIVPTQTRSRICTGGTFGGNCNAAVLSQSQNCNAEVICPGTLSDWGVWGACSATCNTQVNGPFQLRNRQCVGASTWNPTFVGCSNAIVQEQQLCNQLVPCPGVYGAWAAWESCSETCQSNTNTPPFQRQTRPCIGATLNGGCPGAASQTQVCNVGVSCPGALTGWAAWGVCSASCQLGFISPTQTRDRQCIGATFGGICNRAPLSDTQNCNEQVYCPGTISDWSSWSSCSASCNNLVTQPSQSRSRSCFGYSTWDPSYTGCPGINRNEQTSCNLNVGCPGTYTDWSAWSSCSESCQSNSNLAPSQTQTRQCLGATLGGGCVGPISQSISCNVGVPCPGVLSAWAAYGACSASCQLNFIVPTQTRTRTCTGASLGGNCNAAVLSQSQNCNAEVICPGTLSDWGVWGACSATCNTQVNGPFQLRNRQCVGASTWNPTFIGCNNAVVQEQQLCNQLVPCPGVYGAWTAWEVCSETCQSNTNTPPFQRQTRPCIGATLNGGCPGAASQTQACNVGVSCPGDLTQWSAFTVCSQSCQIGSIAPTMSRVRTCLNPTFNGNCLGQPLTDVQPCNAGLACPGQLTEWTSWTQCPATCQQAVGQFNLQFRSRQCANTSFTGNCGGALLNDQITCVKDVPCPGILTQWSAWSLCSESCRSNLLIAPSQTRTRRCEFATLGANCGGALLTETVSCSANVGCPGVWTSWGPFTECSATCQSTGNNVPTQSRQRFCVNNTLDGACPSDNNGDKIQTVQCNAGVICPVRGTWGAWGDWSSCSASCDAGVIQRSRACSVPYPIGAGDNCIGNTTQTLPCKLFDCPKSCAIAKRCNCSLVKQWSSVPEFDLFQSRGLTLGGIDVVLKYLSSYSDDTVDKACQACNTMMLTTLRSNVADQLTQAKAARAKLELIKNDLRDVIYCNGVILNNAGLWNLYDLMFERATMLDGVIIELNAIYLRFDAALTSCQSYGWVHQTFKTILRKCTF